MAHGLPPYLSLSIVGLVVLRLIYRTRRSRVLNPSRLWIRPAIVLAIAVIYVLGAIHAGVSLSGTDIMIISLTAAIGIALGAIRGHSLKLTRHPETGAVEATLTVWGLAVILLWVAGRMFMRQSRFADAVVPFGVFTDASLALAVAAFIAQAIVLSRRCQALIASGAVQDSLR